MRRYRGGYILSTRHPWPCLLFLLPLLIVYEAGVVWLGGPQPEALRNGADTWLRWGLESFGLTQLYCAPALIAVVFLLWSVVRYLDRPDGVIGICMGMAAESVLFGLGLWALSRELGPFLDEMGIKLNVGPNPKVLGRIVTFVGAGIYEEVLFRLVLFFILRRFFRHFFFSSLVAIPLTMIASAVLFSACHHIGPYGEPFNSYVFLFRLLAGFYFALLYQLRGFGIAVGTHAFYDVLVGVLMA
jgi:membrane protease YdiL (CAAX protease family)